MLKSAEGKIIKGIGGFYYVDVGIGIIECRARGKFRYDGVTPLVGDTVCIQDSYVVDIFPRNNELKRPRVANVDKAFIVFAVKEPKINYEILDRFIVLAAEAGVKAVICINKIDLDKANVLLDNVKEVYGECGCNIVEVSARNNYGIEEALCELRGVTTVFAGPSGVGKSSIINLLVPDLDLKTGVLSKKIGRGRHTTREAALHPLSGGGYVVDTPGFTSLSLDHIPSKDLAGYFHEFDPFIGGCKYSSCSHVNEDASDCAVKAEVGKRIHFQRYKSYESIYLELLTQEVNKYD